MPGKKLPDKNSKSQVDAPHSHNQGDAPHSHILPHIGKIMQLMPTWQNNKGKGKKLPPQNNKGKGHRAPSQEDKHYHQWKEQDGIQSKGETVKES